MNAITAASAEEWAQACSDSFVPCGIDHVAPDFRGWLDEAVLLPDSTVIRVMSEPMDVIRSPRHVAGGARDDYFMCVVHGGDGPGVVEQNGRTAEIRPGEAVLVDTSRPYRWWFPAGIDQVVLKISREMLRDRGQNPKETCVLPLPSSMPAVRVFAAFAREVAAVAGEADDPLLLAELGHTAGDLLTTLLRSAHGEPARSSAGRRAMLLAMQRLVLENLAEPWLSPAAIAARFGVSVRYTTALFGDDGTSPAAYIRDRRLDGASKALTDPRRRGVSVAAVSHQFGFADTTTFTRAFRRRFGANPAEYRVGDTSG